MAQQVINIGTLPNDGTGDPLRTAYDKCNDNFTELYAALVSGLIRSGSEVVIAGINTITFSAPLPTVNYSLVVYDLHGAGGEVVLGSEGLSGFQWDGLGAGMINYVAILNI